MGVNRGASAVNNMARCDADGREGGDPSTTTMERCSAALRNVKARCGAVDAAVRYCECRGGKGPQTREGYPINVNMSCLRDVLGEERGSLD